MYYSNYSILTVPETRIHVGYMIRCHHCRSKTQSSIREKIDYINDGSIVK